MGTWGTGAFQNDDASDWLYELDETDGLEPIESALESVLEADGIEAPDASMALAAAEVVAALAGKPLVNLPDGARTFIAGRPRPDAALVEMAHRAVTAIGGKSELLDLWQDSEEFAKWKATLASLDGRLKPAA